MEINTQTISTVQAKTSASGAVSSDFETFLKMLTVQLQNQDPLNPTEASDYAVQLATFSGVEQQVKTNDLLSQMTARMNGENLAEYGAWIGQDILTTEPVPYTGEPVVVVRQLDPAYTSAELIVTDTSGNFVHRAEWPDGETQFHWSGLDAENLPVEHGNYVFSVLSYVDGQAVSDQPAAAYGPVSEVRVNDGQMNIILTGGTEVALADVMGLRSPN